jgi:hypothetical protein
MRVEAFHKLFRKTNLYCLVLKILQSSDRALTHRVCSIRLSKTSYEWFSITTLRLNWAFIVFIALPFLITCSKVEFMSSFKSPVFVNIFLKLCNVSFSFSEFCSYFFELSISFFNFFNHFILSFDCGIPVF